MICCLISKSSIYSQPNEQYKISWNQKQEGLHNLAFTKATKLFQYPQRVQLTKFSLAFFSVNHRCNFVWINCDFSSAVNSVSSRESNFSCCWPVETDVGHCTMGPCWSWASCGWFLGVCCHFFWSFYPWYKKWLEPFVWYFTDSLFDCELVRYLPPAQQAPQLLKVLCQDMKLILVSVISNCIAQFKEISSFSLHQSSIQISISLLSGKCEVLSRDLQRVEHW